MFIIVAKVTIVWLNLTEIIALPYYLHAYSRTCAVCATCRSAIPVVSCTCPAIELLSGDQCVVPDDRAPASDWLTTLQLSSA